MIPNKDTSLNGKITMAESFLDSAIFHEETLDLVRFDRIDSPQGEKVEGTLRRKRVTHFLYAMVFELSIKIIWEIEQGEEAPHCHNIRHLYKKLSPESKKRISDMYDTQVSTTKNLIAQLNELTDNHGNPWDINPDLQSLEDALKTNEKTVVDFKYDGQFKGKSSVLCSMMVEGRSRGHFAKSFGKCYHFSQSTFSVCNFA